MGDWWIDDDRYPGPGEDWIDLEAYARAFIQVGRAVGKAWVDLTSDPIADLVEWQKLNERGRKQY